MKRKIFAIILVLLMIGVVGLYIYEVAIKGADPTDNLFRMAAIVAICVINLLRLNGLKQRKPLEFYASQYADVLQNAFAGSFYRNKLLCAVRLYNEENLRKAVKYLLDLQTRCKTREDYYAVYLFLGLCFTDMHLYKEAIRVYRELIRSNMANSRIYSNLGYALSKEGELEMAMTNYKQALAYDRSSEYAHQNIAQLYFEQHNLEEALTWSHKALELNPKFHQASTMLAIIYAIKEQKEEADKYFHIAIANGQNADTLKKAIEYYCTRPDMDGKGENQ